MLKEFQASTVDLYLDQGDSYYREFTLRDGGGIPINLTGYTLEMTIKRYANTVAVVVTSVLAFTDITTGVFTINIAHSETSKLINTRYVYEIKAIGASDRVKILQGQMLVNNF